MIFLERLRELFHSLLPLRNTRLYNSQSNTRNGQNDDSGPKPNPWTRDLERLACYSHPETKDWTESGEMKIQLLMEQARLEKAKEVLKQQQQQQRQFGEAEPPKPREKRTPRKTDATITDTKAWWGQAVATWDPEDAKNLGPQGEIRHPRQHKWFNQ